MSERHLPQSPYASSSRPRRTSQTSPIRYGGARASLSPNKSIGFGLGRGNVLMDDGLDLASASMERGHVYGASSGSAGMDDQPSPASRHTPSASRTSSQPTPSASRMSLSALVNSPPQPLEDRRTLPTSTTPIDRHQADRHAGYERSRNDLVMTSTPHQLRDDPISAAMVYERSRHEPPLPNSAERARKELAISTTPTSLDRERAASRHTNPTSPFAWPNARPNTGRDIYNRERYVSPVEEYPVEYARRLSNSIAYAEDEYAREWVGRSRMIPAHSTREIVSSQERGYEVDARDPRSRIPYDYTSAARDEYARIQERVPHSAQSSRHSGASNGRYTDAGLVDRRHVEEEYRIDPRRFDERGRLSPRSLWAMESEGHFGPPDVRVTYDGSSRRSSSPLKSPIKSPIKSDDLGPSRSLAPSPLPSGSTNGDLLPRPKPKRKSGPRRKKIQTAALEDEILDLAESGGEGSLLPDRVASRRGSIFSGIMDDDSPEPDGTRSRRLSEVMSCGLTRREVIDMVERRDVAELPMQDIRAVQDETLLSATEVTRARATARRQVNRQKVKERKVDTIKEGETTSRRSSVSGVDEMSERGHFLDEDKEGLNGDWDDNREPQGQPEPEEAGDDVLGEAEADIAALLEDRPKRKSKSRSKKRKHQDDGEHPIRVRRRDMAMYDTSDEEKPDPFDEIDSVVSELLPVAKKPKSSRSKNAGIGKGRWPRPSKEEKDLTRKAEVIAVQNVMGDPETAIAEALEEGTKETKDVLEALPGVPNTVDPRGVSDVEAKVRFGLMQELQDQAWQAIVKDVPRMYRVYQQYDVTLKQDLQRTSHAAMRNAFFQRSMKPTYKSAARINKETITKSRRVIKEMLLYWRKNEKDELAARKKAEKEALEKAKAEEEAREAKRQSRKLNFLLTQTELYSHFVGKKIKTKEAEGHEGADIAEGANADKDNERDELMQREVEARGELGLDAEGNPLPDIDYDDDDEENLRRHAARGAHAAVQAAREKAKAFDDARAAANQDAPQDLDLDGDELNFQNPTLAEDSITITQPKMLMAQLKEYQLKGLTWLGNLYEQGINGILADEMGLGKTIQSISLLAYLAEHHNLWGPFLVIAPSSTLHNWQQELARFVPRLKALPYWGSPKDRETLRRVWSRKNLTFTEDSPFHVLVTSYQLAVQDDKYFHATRWQYMILDEAQAIKSSSSARWKSLLSMHCRNRLLLTGTPIQNSMHELWALLHFIMPSLFDSHEEFSEWFSKDIENAAGGGSGALKPEQLRRLHMILKPFMLRRVKKHVQKELGDKIEIDLLVDLSQRQRNIYKALRQRVSIADLIAQANNLTDTAGAKNLMNLVMQFRKVCNHPDLFERADVVSPYVFGSFSQSGNLAREGDNMYCPDSGKNLIEVNLPRLIWTDGGKLDIPGEDSLAGSDTKVLGSLMNIWNAGWINESLKNDSDFGFLKVLNMSAGEAARRAKAHPLVQMLHRSQDAENETVSGEYASDQTFAASSKSALTLLAPPVPSLRPSSSAPALTDITLSAWNESFFSRRDARFASDPAVAPYVKPVISNRSYLDTQSSLASDPIIEKAFYGPTPSEQSDPLATSQITSSLPGVGSHGLMGDSSRSEVPWSTLRVPPPKRLIVDSAKLARLDDLLRELKDGGHRVLLYFQMTKMMDLVEEYLIFRQYKYLRLDGSSPIGERRDMVTSFQTNPDFFIFCLSTRAGGLGINLTAADTVIFYDHDWNPSNDAQAMDRAHRVGQTKQVTVYRLIARGTIEERILKLARAKKDVQDIVVGTKSLTDVAKPSEIVSLFMDDDELAESVAKRKQAEAHGYVVPTSIPVRPKSRFGDGLGISNDDDEDDFFNVAKKPANTEDDDLGPGDSPNGAGAGGKSKKKPKRKAKDDGDGTSGGGTPKKKPQKKKVKLALGPDGLPI